MPPPVTVRIVRLTLTNFRSYRAASLAVDRALVVLVGPNGAGKTNLLEAISFLTPGRGLRRATVEEAAFAEGDGSWAVAAEVEGALGPVQLGTGIDPPAEGVLPVRRFRIDQEKAASAAAFADHLRVVWLVPEMDGLFLGPASERRRFLDRLVLAIDAEHGTRVSALERALRSRNRLLEDAAPDPRWLDAVEHEVAELAFRYLGRVALQPIDEANCLGPGPNALRAACGQAGGAAGARIDMRTVSGQAERRIGDLATRAVAPVSVPLQSPQGVQI